MPKAIQIGGGCSRFGGQDNSKTTLTPYIVPMTVHHRVDILCFVDGPSGGRGSKDPSRKGHV
jgi:hypothetical protein